MLPFFLLLLVAIGLGATGQVLLKHGLRQLPDGAPALAVLASIFTNIHVFLGFASYGLSSLMYLIVLKRLPLSYAYPMVALSYVLVVGLSWKLFGEEIPPLRVCALAAILAGVVMLALSYNAPDADEPGAVSLPPDSGLTAPADPT